MKRIICLVAALCLLTPGALAQGVAESAPLTGEQYFPSIADAQSATYCFTYALPQFAADTEADVAINAYYADLATDLTDTVMPQTVASLDETPAADAPAWYTAMDYRVTLSSADYLSVLLTSRQFLGNAETESWSANVFARSGVYAGQQISLSQAMGLEQEDDANATGNSYAAQLVYGLVWQNIAQQQAMLQIDFFPGLTQADLENVFTPESDFYLDADGNVVFFIQSGQIAGEVEGILTYPFSRAELLSAVGT